jgi:hypothetical protein
MKKYSYSRLSAAALLTLALTARPVHAGPGSIATPTELKSAPDPTAATISQLAPGSIVQVGERSGGWYKVSTPQGEGWVRMLSLRIGTAPAGSGASLGNGLAALNQASRSNTTVATGVRGLTREELKTAQEDLVELDKLEQFTVSPQDASRFAQGAGLPALPTMGVR